MLFLKKSSIFALCSCTNKALPSTWFTPLSTYDINSISCNVSRNNKMVSNKITTLKTPTKSSLAIFWQLPGNYEEIKTFTKNCFFYCLQVVGLLFRTAFQRRIQMDFLEASILSNYRTYSTYSDRQVRGNSVNPDQTPQTAASDQGFHCLSLTKQFYTHSQIVKWACWRNV